jgi:ketosteroid isomerase-like protein
MSSEDNIKTIQAVYEAFGRGDVAAIVEAVTDDVDWASEGASSNAPWYGEHRGKDAVGRFFQEFGTTMSVQAFEPLAFGANDTDVFAVVQFKATPLAGGPTAEMRLHHWFRFEDGKIAYYRGSEDTAQTEHALGH